MSVSPPPPFFRKRTILDGEASVENFNVLDNDWNIEERTQAALSSWELDDKSLSHPMSLLSGGEKTRVFLAGMELHAPSVVLLNEPTNHLGVMLFKHSYCW